MKIEWVEGFRILVNAHNDEVTLSANKEGLLSLARQLQALAEEAPGAHIHYDESNSLEAGSLALIVEKVQ